MNIFSHYLKKYWKLGSLVFVLAVINQVFSLFEPIIFQKVIDNYALKFASLSESEFFRGVGLLLLAYMGTALVSRIAKNFQDYYLNTISQRSGADMYREGVKHSLSLPYAVFEDERSGETLGKLQKARQDTEKLIIDIINSLALPVLILIFIGIYASTINWVIPFVFLGAVILIGSVSMFMSKKIKAVQTQIVSAILNS